DVHPHHHRRPSMDRSPGPRAGGPVSPGLRNPHGNQCPLHLRSQAWSRSCGRRRRLRHPRRLQPCAGQPRPRRRTRNRCPAAVQCGGAPEQGCERHHGGGNRPPNHGPAQRRPGGQGSSRRRRCPPPEGPGGLGRSNRV
ncbi:hypothetical protein, partial [Arthrobacter sp. DR-2P]